VIPAAKKHDQTKNILLSSIEAMIGALRTKRVNTLRQTIRKNNMAENAVTQYRKVYK
jgi:hypothetical protein